jgi:hypothetical protein
MSSFQLFFPKKPCEEAIRKWLEVKVRKQLPLQGGVSGANVYFIDAEIAFPGLHATKPKQLKFVIKFSSSLSFDEEKKRFRELPDELKKWFIDFATQRTLSDGDFFMIMPYLDKYQTLAFLINHGKVEQVKEIIQKVWEACKGIHFWEDKMNKSANPFEKRQPDVGKLCTLYLGGIKTSLDKSRRIVDFLKDQERGFEANKHRFSSPRFYLEEILKKAPEISPCFSTLTHGDFHSRNILILPSNLDLKLIDIGNFQSDGDYIYDIGTLVADLETFNPILQGRLPHFGLTEISENTFSYTFPRSPNVSTAIESLMGNVRKLADELGDEKWQTRLSLAKARYLLDMVSRTDNYDKAFVVYCEGLKALSSSIE